MQSTLEILGDPEAFTRQMIRSASLNLWSAMPGIIESVNIGGPDGQPTVSVQPTIMGLLAKPEGGADLVPLPILPDVPVLFFGGGGMTITTPIKPGDECLVIFADRCIDGWWWLGGVQPPSEARNHDLSDGFALVGLRSRPRWLQGVSTESLQIRSDDGFTCIDVNPGGAVQITARQVRVVAQRTDFDGEVWANGHRIDDTHRHGGVQSGGAETGEVAT